MRVLVVDDTVVFRKVISDALAAMPDVEVIGTASNGRIALSRIKDLNPDLVTLDVEMPDMTGIEVLEALNRDQSKVGVIMFSAATTKGGTLTMRALELGAFDFVPKPTGTASMEESREAVKAALGPKIKAFAQRRAIQNILRGKPAPGAPAAQPVPATATAGAPASSADALRQISQRMASLSTATKPEMVLIGISTGGPNALCAMLPQLPGNLNVPILIVQHIPPIFSQALADNLNARCQFRVKEAVDGEAVLPNVAYVAPGGKQMKIDVAQGEGKVIRITDDPPENNCKPSVDYLFRSAAHHFPGKSTSVIMTGMGSDGTIGLRLLKRHGGLVIAQDEASCVVFGMPKEAIGAGVVDLVVPLDGIASAIVKSVRGLSQ